MKKPMVALAAASLFLAGCSTTVDGTPVADPSGVPKAETGSFSTIARTIGATTQADGEALEGYRMAETVPYLYEIEPSFHLRGDVTAVARSNNQTAVKNLFGQAAADAFGAKAEVFASVGAGDKQQGAKYDSKNPSRGVTVAVIRMASPADATSAVGAGLRATDKDSSGKDGPAKVQTQVPGYDAAVAYTQTYDSVGTSTIAYLAYKQYILGVYGDFSADQIRTYFDKQTKALDGFAPTPLDKVTTLQRDPDGVAKLTLAPSSGNGGYALNARQAVLSQTDVSRSVKTFADAGVDAVGRGGSTVYRAKDAKGAQHIVDEFVAENRADFSKIEEDTITGAPGARCLTYPTYEGSSSTISWCVVAVGRYTAEFASSQRAQAKQGIAAAYLILKAGG